MILWFYEDFQDIRNQTCCDTAQNKNQQMEAGGPKPKRNNCLPIHKNIDLSSYILGDR